MKKDKRQAREHYIEGVHPMNEYEQKIIEIAQEIIRDVPGTSPQKALRHAKDIYRNRKKYKISAEEKSIEPQETRWEQIPEHVRMTILKQKKAQKKRESEGRELPQVHFFSGGKVSPK